MKRLFALDYLRGLAAFGIMMYHYLYWNFGKFPADTFMGRLGLYGVSIFYILSGLTLYYVYHNKMKPSNEDILSFFRKRIFRIFPLLWLVTVISIILSKKVPNLLDLFLNLSGLFGFVSWDRYFSPGVWSIGNELVFYAFFPIFILFLKKSKPALILLSLMSLGLYLYFAFVSLNPAVPLHTQWRNYINPLNQGFLFLSGFLIGHSLQNLKIKNSISITLLLCGLLFFIFYPVTGDGINLVTGTNRLIFTASSLLICVGVYKLTIKLPDFIHIPLTFLGEASYSIYLLHPLVYTLVMNTLRIPGIYFVHTPIVSLLISVLATLILSYFVYHYFEKFFMKLGRSTPLNLVFPVKGLLR